MTNQEHKNPEIVSNAFAGKHALITGGGSGIGAASARALALSGANITLLGRNKERLESGAQTLNDTGRTIATVQADVSDPDSIKSAFATAKDQHGPISILINNAGIAPSAPFLKTDLDLWNQVLAVDLTGAFLCAQQVLGDMLKNNNGRIINVASTAGLTGFGYVSAYCAAKHGLIGLTRSLAQETAKKGVTVNAVCPGYTDTAIVSSSVENIVGKTGMSDRDAIAALTAHNPQGRLIEPGEVAATIAWLCLPSSSAITGQSILVAGGELM